MKITFLGSSHGAPSAERFCSSALLEVGESLYLIDAGAPVVDLLLRYGKDVNQLRSIFLTHAHSDHVDGLMGLTSLCQWWYTKASFDILVTEQGIADTFTACVEATVKMPFAKDRIRYRLAEAGEVYTDENIKVTYLPTRHIEPRPSYAILIEAEGKSVLFTGDLSNKLMREDFPRYALENKTDLVVCEMAHFGLEHVEPYMKELLCDHLCFSHVYPLDKLDQIAEADASGAYPYHLSIAHDGDEIEI